MSTEAKTEKRWMKSVHVSVELGADWEGACLPPCYAQTRRKFEVTRTVGGDAEDNAIIARVVEEISAAFKAGSSTYTMRPPAAPAPESVWQSIRRTWAINAPKVFAASGLTLEQFAEKLRVAPITAKAYLRRPTVKRMNEIAAALGTTREALMQEPA